MLKFDVFGSSNLLETNNCWGMLKDKNDLSFANYNDLFTPLVSENNNGIIGIIFFDDISENVKDLEKFSNNQSKFLTHLEMRLDACSNPIILCLGRDDRQSTIESSRMQTRSQKMYSWLYSQLEKTRDKYDNFFLVDIDKIFHLYGADKMYSARNWYMSRL